MVFELSDFESYDASVPRALDTARLQPLLADQTTILLKPNLVNTSRFPVTTSPDFCRTVITYIQACSNATIILGEGCGDSSHDTDAVFRHLGFEDLAREFDIELLDLNHAPLVKKNLDGNLIFPEIYLPEIAFDSFIISLPVLKAHSLAVVTGTLKNMMGFAPPKYYSGSGVWKKAMFHEQMQTSIKELCRYRTPDLTIMDASVGLAEYHLGGPCCSPPVKKIQ